MSPNLPHACALPNSSRSGGRLVDENQASPDDPAVRGGHGELQRLSYENSGEGSPLPSLWPGGPSEGISCGVLGFFAFRTPGASFALDRFAGKAASVQIDFEGSRDRIASGGGGGRGSIVQCGGRREWFNRARNGVNQSPPQKCSEPQGVGQVEFRRRCAEFGFRGGPFGWVRGSDSTLGR